MLVSGYFRLPHDIPKPFWRYPMSFVSFHYWALQGQYQNDLKGLIFDNQDEMLPKIPGEYILENVFQIDVNRSKVAGPVRALQHDHHLPPALLRHDQGQRGRDAVGTRLHCQEVGAEQAATQGGARHPDARRSAATLSTPPTCLLIIPENTYDLSWRSGNSNNKKTRRKLN